MRLNLLPLLHKDIYQLDWHHCHSHFLPRMSLTALLIRSSAIFSELADAAGLVSDDSPLELEAEDDEVPDLFGPDAGLDAAGAGHAHAASYTFVFKLLTSFSAVASRSLASYSAFLFCSSACSLARFSA